jgi:hypothetical protein
MAGRMSSGEDLAPARFIHQGRELEFDAITFAVISSKRFRCTCCCFACTSHFAFCMYRWFASSMSFFLNHCKK